ncbi:MULTISPECIES: multidrug effflux MFS transporter [Commensalibacter]|uniref:Bcr/CflA family efflux transporter n=2 Tax=Commensalibacter TaxID=1079922 RepID=W7E0K4_9PROT|nr:MULTISPECIES: multidrug effflux MFS transporter [Commensalibacter]EUK18524.1 Bcr/CflA subfamily drug resistance transporter [Commensalibacter papalotli (ex Servin-Garciduenas et al. 2014)]CAI3932297.1 MFS family (AraJ) (PDB:4LDS) [Commensalibacter papalotli (ex Botero et al. 2024)]CAI3943370.1 MFS family (AraJ) (PDB:4LDS) [Commensalibacter papalotli (ex Botero et al. 2024)]
MSDISTTPPSTMNSFNEKLSIWVIIILGLLTAIGPLATDMYLPAFPQINEDLAGYGDGAAKMTLTVWFIGLALGQLSIGPISDRLGRRAPLLIGIIVFTIGSIGCAIFSDFYVFCFFRFLSSLGGSAGMVIPRAMVRDISSGSKGIKIMAQLALVSCIVPIVAPTLGGLIVIKFPWQILFWIMGIYGIIGSFIVYFYLPDTLMHRYRIYSSIRSIFWRYIRIVREPIFFTNTMITGFALFMIFAYLSGTPDVLSKSMGFTKLQLAIWFGINSFIIAACNQVNGLLLNKIRPYIMLNIATNIAFATSILFIIICLLPIPLNTLGIVLHCAPIVIIMGCLGFVFPNCTIFAFILHGRRVGSASALLGTIQFLLGAVSSWMMSKLPSTNMLSVAIGVFIGVLGMFLFNLWRRNTTRTIIKKMKVGVQQGQHNYYAFLKDLD